MFYPELSQIKSYKFAKSFIDELDRWLAFLPRNKKNKITVSLVSQEFDIEYDIVKNLLNEICITKVLEYSYGIFCPNCEHCLEITSKDHLIENLSLINFCYNCEEDIEPNIDNVIIMYSLVKEPDRTQIDSFFESPRSNTPTEVNVIDYNNSLLSLLNTNPEELYSLFFNPTLQEISNLNDSFTYMSRPHQTNGEKGDSLNDFIVKLFSLIKTFRCSAIIRNHTNQMDCSVYNKLCIKPSVFEYFGDLFIIECKNEIEKPDNTYFHKLHGILVHTGYKFGIIASRLPWARTCDNLARDLFLCSKMIIINLSDSDYEAIIANQKNLLDIIAYKIEQVKIDATRNIGDIFEEAISQ